MNHQIIRFFLITMIIGLIGSSCKKESFITSTDASLFTTVDTIKFDTLFTNTGSITKSFKIINDNNQKLLISTIQLMGGNTSSFKLNINGVAASILSNIEIDANDSIYVFVSVNANPSNSNLPFLINDSILISYNGNNRFVQLQAYGQRAHFLTNIIIDRDTIWENDLPYVISGSLLINPNVSLTLNAGCKIYAHANAPILVDGTLIVNGEKNNEVVFTGDRLDEYYKDLPASWPGIYFRKTSTNNTLTYAILKNATDALVVDSIASNTHPKLSLHQCIVDNALKSGLLSTNSSVDADNTLISNCGKNISIQQGGVYHFTNCTIAAYSNNFILHNNPILQLNNFSSIDNIIISNTLSADFKNCILWGEGLNYGDEISIGKEGNNTFDVSFRNCLINSSIDNSIVNLDSIIRNQDPLFDSIDAYHNYYDFRTTINTTSPVIDAGRNTIPSLFPKDLDDHPRIFGLKTDIGCYEKQN